MTRAALLLLRVYQLTLGSLFCNGVCRFTPGCSVYAGEAIRRHGVFKGAWLAFTRICRCHPWGGKGFDPVP